MVVDAMPSSPVAGTSLGPSRNSVGATQYRDPIEGKKRYPVSQQHVEDTKKQTGILFDLEQAGANFSKIVPGNQQSSERFVAYLNNIRQQRKARQIADPQFLNRLSVLEADGSALRNEDGQPLKISSALGLPKLPKAKK